MVRFEIRELQHCQVGNGTMVVLSTPRHPETEQEAKTSATSIAAQVFRWGIELVRRGA